MSEQKTCEQRINSALADRLEDLVDINKREAWEELNEYFLDVSYVEPHTFEGQVEGYVRMQISWGGPSDEFRVFLHPDGSVHRIEYWFMDWFDGASQTLNHVWDCIVWETWYHFEGFIQLPTYP